MRIAGKRISEVVSLAVRWGHEKVPPGLRSLLGVLLVIGGLFGFLPILGFWMIPVGGALIALDVPALRRRVVTWVERAERRDQDRQTP